MENLSLFDIENNVLVINKVDILTTKHLKEVFERKTTIPKIDPRGVNKMRNIQELAYIHQMIHYDCHVFRNGLIGNKAIEYAKEIVGLPDEWEADEVVKAAMVEYEGYVLSVEHILCKRLHDKYSNSVNFLNKAEQIITKEFDKDGLSIDAINKLMKYQDTLDSALNKLEEKMKSIIELRRSVLAGENNSIHILRGTEGKVVPNSAMPGQDFTDNIEDVDTDGNDAKTKIIVSGPRRFVVNT